MDLLVGPQKIMSRLLLNKFHIIPQVRYIYYLNSGQVKRIIVLLDQLLFGCSQFSTECEPSSKYNFFDSY